MGRVGWVAGVVVAVRACPRGAALLTALALALAGVAEAQNPDLMLTPAERDSVLAEYDNIFPLLGRKAIERGFDLPKPLGLNLIGVYVDQHIDIGGLGLSTNDNPIMPVEFIDFGTNTSTVTTLNARLDLWVLPFLNIYGLGGKAWANTTVEISEPIAFTSSVDQTGTYFGTGLTAAFGFKRNFVSVDQNWTWTSLEKLDEAVRGAILSFRVGRTLKLGPRERMAFWVGAMRAKIATETTGSIALSEAVPPETVDRIRDQLENVEDSDWYQDLGPGQKALVDEITERLLDSGLGDMTINYQLDKSLADPWNMLVGANYDFSKRWTVRSEVGFLGRFSVLVNAVYRLDL